MLWLEGKVTMSELDEMSIDDVDRCLFALYAWQDAEVQANN